MRKRLGGGGVEGEDTDIKPVDADDDGGCCDNDLGQEQHKRPNAVHCRNTQYVAKQQHKRRPCS